MNFIAVAFNGGAKKYLFESERKEVMWVENDIPSLLARTIIHRYVVYYDNGFTSFYKLLF